MHVIMGPTLKRARVLSVGGAGTGLALAPARDLTRLEDRVGAPVRALAARFLLLLATAILVGGVASGAARASTRAIPAPVVQGPDDGLTNGTSTNWSGYVAETNLAKGPNRVVNDVKGQWVVPSFTCPPMGFTFSAMWVGIDGWTNRTVEQTGTLEECNFDAFVSYTWYEMYPAPLVRVLLPAQPGDLMSADVAYGGNHSFVLTISNLTEGGTFTTTQKSSAKRQSAEWIAEAPSSGGVIEPLTNFGTVSFTGASATFDNTTGPINSPSWEDEPITMTDPSGTVKAVPSALDPSGQSFNVTWEHS
jgi:hypothetical protein